MFGENVWHIFEGHIMQFTISSLMNSVRKDSFNVDEFKKSCAFFEVLLQYLIYVQKKPLEMFCKKAVLKNFVIFTWKHLCCSLFFNKFIKETPILVPSCVYWEIFKNTYFEEHLLLQQSFQSKFKFESKFIFFRETFSQNYIKDNYRFNV